MKKGLQDMLSICIFGGSGLPEVADCVACAAELTDSVVLIDPYSRELAQTRAAEFGISSADIETLGTAFQDRWILFIRPNERVKIRSLKELRSELKSHSTRLHVHVKDTSIARVLTAHQFIANLGQYARIGDHAQVNRLEARLAKREDAAVCLKALIDETSADLEATVEALRIETISYDNDREVQQDPDEHDLQCLKGDRYYGPVPGEELDELSTAFIGFRVLHKGYLDGFRECADKGLCSDQMYLSMLFYLNKEGDFEKTKDLLDLWVKNRIGPEIKELYNVAGVTYAHLFQLEGAIANFEKAGQIASDAQSFKNAAKLALIQGEKERAVGLFKKANEIEPEGSETQYFLSIIEDEKWRPLTLSVCMIAKDEDALIGNALESVKYIADEIIVVDTGSTDRTKEIVREHGGIIIEYEWEDDFSAARNLALNQAHGDYVLVLDADEFIDIRDRVSLALFKKILPSSADVAYRIRIVHEEDPLSLSVSQLSKLTGPVRIEEQVRFFPGRNMAYFTAPVYETVEPSLQEKSIAVENAQLFKITHRRENPEMRDRRKIAAVDKLFLSPLALNSVIEAGLLFLRLGDLEKAYRWFEKARGADPKLMAKIAELYMQRNLFAWAGKMIGNALIDTPDSPELLLGLAKFRFREERYLDVHEALSPWIECRAEEMESESMGEAYFYFGTALLEMGRIAEGIEYISRALESGPVNVRYQVGALRAFAETDQWMEFLEVLQQVLLLEGIEIRYAINNFVDIAHVMLELVRHFASAKRLIEIKASRRILEILVRTKIDEQSEIEQVMMLITETSQLVSAQGVVG